MFEGLLGVGHLVDFLELPRDDLAEDQDEDQGEQQCAGDDAKANHQAVVFEGDGGDGGFLGELSACANFLVGLGLAEFRLEKSTSEGIGGVGDVVGIVAEVTECEGFGVGVDGELEVFRERSDPLFADILQGVMGITAVEHLPCGERDIVRSGLPPPVCSSRIPGPPRADLVVLPTAPLPHCDRADGRSD